MSEGILKFRELMQTDKAFQSKLEAALENYKGEKTEKAVFEAVLTPLAQEYGISATFEEYLDAISDQELSLDELNQVAGGTAKTNNCSVVGLSPNLCPAGIGPDVFQNRTYGLIK